MAADVESFIDGSAEDYARCVFCRDSERSTKLLLCCHPVCDTCLTASDIVGEGTITCEKCSAVTFVSFDVKDGGQRSCSLQANPFQDVWARVVSRFDTKPCIMCLTQSKVTMGTHVCLECGGDYLCKSCLPFHAAMGATKHHQPVPLANLKESEHGRLVRAQNNQDMCTMHSIAVKYCCFVNQPPVCKDCHQTEHLDRIKMAESFDDQVNSITPLRQTLDLRLLQATWQRAEIEALIEQSHMDEDTGVNEVAERVDAVKKMLDAWGEGKRRELRKFFGAARQQYQLHLARWEASRVPLQSMSTYSKLCLKYAGEQDLGSLHILKDNIANVIKPRLDVRPPLMHSTQCFKWKNFKTIKAKFDELIGSEVTRKRMIVKCVKQIEGIIQQSITGLSHTTEQDVLATGPNLGGILMFAANGAYKKRVKFHDPIVAFDVISHGDEMYVSDIKLRQVKRINMNGHTTHTIKLRHNEPGKKANPIGLALDSERGLLYICSANKDTVYRCAFDDAIAEPFITPDNELPSLRGPTYLHVTHCGDIVVTNNTTHTLHVYDPQGRLQKVVGESGPELGQFHGIVGVATDNFGYMYVAEMDNHRVQVLAPDYNPVGAFPQSDKILKQPFAVLVNAEGDVLVSHSCNNISVFRPIRSATER